MTMERASRLQTVRHPAGAAVVVRRCHQRYGNFVALQSVDLAVEGGEFVTLLGPSGSGKTTLLRILAGLVLPTSGSVTIAGQDVTYMPAEKRDIGMVFQNYALFPHLTIYENVAFPLRIRRLPRREIARQVGEVLDLVGLPNLGQRHPGQLSGGQQQRVAIARALVFRPRVLLMDEPLGSLDKRLRQQLQIEIRKLQKEIGITTIYVTHDQDEAFTISDRIAVMDRGELLQVASPSEVYRAPASRFVADFVGDLNCLRGVIRGEEGGYFFQTEEGLTIPVERTDLLAGSAVVCGIRPEHIYVAARAEQDAFPVTLQVLRFKGDHHRAEAVLESGVRLVVDLPDSTLFREGDEAWVRWRAEDMHLFIGGR